MSEVGTFRIIFQDDVITLRLQVEREVANLDAAIATCPSYDATTWHQERAVVQHWIDTCNAESASILPSGRWGELYSQGMGLEATLRLQWWPRLQAAGCVLPFPQPHAPVEPPLSTDNPSSPLAWLAPLEGLAKAILFLMVAREVREWMK